MIRGKPRLLGACKPVRTLAAMTIASLLAGSVAAQSLGAIAKKGYEGPAGPWIAKYVAATIGTAAPELTVTSWRNREPTKLRNLRNRTVLLYFWATWCGACPEGLAKLQRLAKTSREPLEIITVQLADRDHSKARTLTTLPVAMDQGMTARAYGVKGVPACVLIDPAGIIRFVHIRLPTLAEIDAVAGLPPRRATE